MPKSKHNRKRHNKSHKRGRRGGQLLNGAISPYSRSPMSPPATVPFTNKSPPARAPYSRSPISPPATVPFANKSLSKPKPMSSSQQDFKGTMTKHATTALNAVKSLFGGGRSRRHKRRSRKRHTRKGKMTKSRKRRKHVRR